MGYLSRTSLVAPAILTLVVAYHHEWDDYLNWNYSPHSDEPNYQFQGYPDARRPRPTPSGPGTATATTRTATATTSTATSTAASHRVLLNELYQQILGPNFASPGLKDLAFLSTPTAPSPRTGQLVNQGGYPTATSQGSYVLPQFIQPPPLSGPRFNFYEYQ